MNPLHIIPIGKTDPSLIAWGAACASRELGLWTVTLEPVDEPAEAYDAERGQHSAVEMMRLLARVAPAGSFRVLGITERDLFIPMLSFVLGQAQLKGRLAVVSLARLRQEFYGLPADDLTLRARLRTEILHELGHSFGLIHCPNTVCTMSLSTTVAHVDAKADGYCGSCQAQLEEYLGRYRR